jgi:hypothetical protein
MGCHSLFRKKAFDFIYKISLASITLKGPVQFGINFDVLDYVFGEARSVKNPNSKVWKYQF